MQIRNKHILLSVLLSIWTTVGWTQTPQIIPQIKENWVLDKNESSDSKIYVAKESIKLQTGTATNFYFQATTGKSFSAKIDPGLLFPPDNKTYVFSDGSTATTPTKTINTTTETGKELLVGSIPGNASVSPTGAASYQIPIEVPTGVNGMQPQVSIVYNSLGGFGALGTGWDIAGGSAITRGNKSIYYDNTNNNIKFDNTIASGDALYLDGQRLILLSGTPFTSNATYATEVESYAKVVYNGSGFVLTTKDGKTMEYGNAANSQLKNASSTTDTRVLAWKLNKVTDTYGNSMTYTYTDNGQYLQKIEYAGQSVEFTYNQSLDNPKISYVNDFAVSQTKLLSSITTKSGTTSLKIFGFSYKSSTDNRLNTISESTSDNTQLNSTTINWGAETAFTTLEVGSNSNPDLVPLKGSIYSGDVNGDGYPDRVEMWPGNASNKGNGDGDKGHIAIYLFDNSTKTFNSTASTTLLFAFTSDSNSSELPIGGDNDTRLVVSDINNDGKAEIIIFNQRTLFSYAFESNSLTQKQKFFIDFDGGSFSTNVENQLFSVNVNHDNYNDIAYVINYGKECGYFIYKGGENGLSYEDRSYTNDHFFDKYEFGDFNADGSPELMGIPGSSDVGGIDNSTNKYLSLYEDGNWNYATKTRHVNSADFNGDGLSDILVQDGDYSWHLLLNNGYEKKLLPPQSLSQFHYASDATGNGELDGAIPIDFNGDGQMDVVIGDETFSGSNFVKTTWYFYKNTNGTFTLEKQFDTFSRMAYFTSDVNGDGIMDLIVSNRVDKGGERLIYPCPDNGGGTTPIQQTSTDGLVKVNQPIDPDCTPYKGWVSNYQNIYYAITFPQTNRCNIVTSITDGMGQTNSFSYKNFSAYQPYAASEATAKVRDLRAPLLVVDTQTQPDGSVTSYTFEKPKVHIEGKGFLGFSTVTAVNTTKNAKIVSNYDIESTYFGVNLINQTVSNADGTKIASSSKQYNEVKVIDAAKKRYLPIVTAQWSYDKLKNVVQKVTSNYSSYPSSITQTTEVKDSTTSAIDLTTKVVTTFTGPTGVTPYLPASVTTTRTQGEQSDTRSTSYTYLFNTDATKKYQLTKSTETTNSGDTKYAVTTEYSNPDTWGHMQTVKVTAKNQKGDDESRTSFVSYTPAGSSTPSGRFIASKTNSALNESSTYKWDETLGLLTSETTNVGDKDRTTSYKYNSWGQLVETTYPDGMRKANVVQWNSDATSKYYTYSESSGNSPVWTYYDDLGREVRKETKGLKGNTIRVFTTYRADGKVDKVSDPTFNTSFSPTTDPCTAYGYNTDYGYPESVKTPMGTTSTVYDKLTTTVTSPEGTSVTVTNAAGQTLTSTVNEKTVTYTYYPSGLTHTSTPTGGEALTMAYNPQGKRTSLIDPDGGTIETEYDGFGELVIEKQKIHNSSNYIITTNTYDANGLLLNIKRHNEAPASIDEVTTYTYDSNIKTRVNSIEITGKNKQTFGFDAFNRVISVTEDITKDGVTRTYISGKEYDVFGRIKKEIYPSGYYTVNSYDSYSNLTEVKDKNNHSIWKANTENALGQATSIFKGTTETMYVYDPINHLKTSIKATAAEKIIDYTYGYDSSNNLSWRQDNVNPNNIQSESFTYDTQNRLTNWDVTRAGHTYKNSLSFDANGNITSKSDLGAFTLKYGGEKEDGFGTISTIKSGTANGALTGPHALTTISGIPTYFPQAETSFPAAELSVTYTDFKKIFTLTEKNKYYELAYGIDDQRRISEYYANGKSQGVPPTLTRYYVGNYEEEVDADAKVRKIHYLSGAILIQHDGAADSLLYTYSDAQGSLIALTDADGNLLTKTINGTTVEIGRFAYDPWGARRDPNDWTLKDSRTSFLINRGYTGHEHLDAFGIINMNGRVYDPLTAVFFSPDPYVQAPGDWLNYNRYGYTFGNPFKYTDPNGKWAILDDIVAIVGGGLINLISNWSNTHSFGQGLSYFIAGAAAGEGTLYAPEAFPAISGALGAINSSIDQGFQGGKGFSLKNINFGSALGMGVLSGVTAYAGGQVTNAMHIEKLTSKISSPLLRNVIGGEIGGTIVGGSFGALSAAASGQDFKQGLWNGAKMGFVSGTIGGFSNAVQYSERNHVDLFTGKLKPVYHYTNSTFAPAIEANGIRQSADGFTYTTTNPNYSSPQAIEALNLNPSGGARDALFKIDAPKMAADGILPAIGPRPVWGGSGNEILYRGDIPSNYIFRIK